MVLRGVQSPYHSWITTADKPRLLWPVGRNSICSWQSVLKHLHGLWKGQCAFKADALTPWLQLYLPPLFLSSSHSAATVQPEAGGDGIFLWGRGGVQSCHARVARLTAGLSAGTPLPALFQHVQYTKKWWWKWIAERRALMNSAAVFWTPLYKPHPNEKQPCHINFCSPS